MLFDPKDFDVSFFTRRLRVVSPQEGEQQVPGVLPFCLRDRALGWHTQLPDEDQLDMAHSPPRAITLPESVYFVIMRAPR